jgi:hypothetical protein
MRTRQAGPSEREIRRGMPVMPAEAGWVIQLLRNGRDKRVPPRGGPDKRVPPYLFSSGQIAIRPDRIMPWPKPLYKHDADTRAIRDRFWDYGLSGDDGGISRGVAFAFAGGLSGSDS